MIIGFIGVGKMASAIIKGVKRTGHDIIISGSSKERSLEIAQKLDVKAANSHKELIDEADCIILGIKPQMFPAILKDLTFKQPLISMAAGITLERLAQLTSQKLPLLRIMPNMNAEILESTTALTYNSLVKKGDDILKLTKEITDSFGSTFIITENYFDSFTALAGSSPAYIYLFIEAMTKAGVKNGFSNPQALEIVTQTIIASTKHLLQSGDSPHNLIDSICSPGGTTIAGLMDLEKTGLTHSVVSAIDTTINRAREM